MKSHPREFNSSPTIPKKTYPNRCAKGPEEFNDILFKDIVNIEKFNTRMINALHFIGVTKVHELLSLRKRDLQQAEGIGKKARGIIFAFFVENRLLPFEEIER